MTINTLEEVKQLRNAAKSDVFNMVAAVEALKATPLKAARAVGARDNAFGSDIKSLFIEAQNAGYDALNKLQLANMYCAAKDIEMPTDSGVKAKFLKKFYEHCLAKSDQPSKNNANPVYHYSKESHSFSLI